MKLSDYVIDTLTENGVNHVFELCGGALAHLLDSMYDKPDIEAVSMHHEMAAAIAAEGYARVNGNLGVAMATSGPGATNLITGIGSCYFDSIPCLFITGQVNTYEYKWDSPVRQVGFQETDIVSIIKPIVKDAVMVTEEDKIKYMLEKLIFTAKNGRPGPVLLDIPLNIQRGEIDPDKIESFSPETTSYDLEQNLDQVISLLDKSTRPVILVGGGLRLSNATSELLEFINKTKIPVVSSLMGLDSFPHDHESFVGLIGTYGNRYANLTLANANLVIALGTRLDTRQTGTLPETFARGAHFIHVDIDPSELNNKIKADTAINSDAREFLSQLNHKLEYYDAEKIKEWRYTINSFKVKYPQYPEHKTKKINPYLFMHKLSESIPHNAIICVDVGQNQMWAAQSLNLKKNQRFLTQGGMASIGSALPLAIGASFADLERPIVVISGDGGFQLNIQELETVYYHDLPIKIVLLNNCSYGIVKQFQEQYFNSRFQSTGDGYSCPEFHKVASAYKIPAEIVYKTSELDDAFKKLFSDRKPRFLEVDIRSAENKAFPKLAVNRPIEDQDPELSWDELKSNMLIDPIPRDE